MDEFDAHEGSVYHYDKSLEHIRAGNLEKAVSEVANGFGKIKEHQEQNSEIRARTESAISYIRDGKRSEAIKQIRKIRRRVQELQAKELQSQLNGMR